MPDEITPEERKKSITPESRAEERKKSITAEKTEVRKKRKLEDWEKFEWWETDYVNKEAQRIYKEWEKY